MRHDTDILKRIGTRVRVSRDLAGLTQTELATRSGVSRSYITRIERGTVEATISTLARLAEALGVTMSQLIGDGAVRQRPEAAAVRLLEFAVTQTRGVPVPVKGVVRMTGVEWWGERDHVPVLNVPFDWLRDRNIDDVFALEVFNDALRSAGIPAGYTLLIQATAAEHIVAGDQVLVDDAGHVRIEYWPLDTRDSSDDVIAPAVIGIVLASWKVY
jgi:transcriptional regulator with XRE-family HTH domain